MKAPPFTASNAAEMARRSWIARRQRAAQLAAEAEQARIKAAQCPSPDSDDARSLRVKKQIDLLLESIESPKTTTEERIKASAAIERLWKLTQPTAGTLRPSRSKSGRAGSNPFDVQPVTIPATTAGPTPQPVVFPASNPHEKPQS